MIIGWYALTTCNYGISADAGAYVQLSDLPDKISGLLKVISATFLTTGSACGLLSAIGHF